MTKKKEAEVVEEVAVKSNVAQTAVTTNLDVDPNDPRLKPIVDGNTQPVIDINVPQ